MNMKKVLCFILCVLTFSGCEDQLDVPNPNRPTPESARSESGLISLAQGGLYASAQGTVSPAGILQSFVMTLHERMGDIAVTTLVPTDFYTPERIILDDGSQLQAFYSGGQKAYLKDTNIPGVGNNTINEWVELYRINGTMNAVLENVDLVNMPDEKRRTIKAWAYFWKGFAYSRIGSLYYAGIINDQFNVINNRYVTKEEMMTASEENLYRADTILTRLSGSSQYLEVLDKLIPSLCKVGKGGVLSTDEWKRNINTLRARNLLINTPASQMTTVQWDQVIALAGQGLQAADKTFTVRTDANSSILATNGYAAAQLVGPASNGGGGNKVSERWIQDFKPGDKRFTNNFNTIPTYIGPGDRSISVNTRYVVVNKGKGMSGVLVYVNRDAGAQELYIVGTYEENLLMLAEANINKGNIDGGLAYIDQVRVYQGAGLAPVSGTGLTMDEAKEELRKERRVALAFRGLSFYDARRWGVLENGRNGCTVIESDATVNTNALIEYGFVGYWDVPVYEWFYNPPSSDSAPIVNPD
jgi:hypothetical protein